MVKAKELWATLCMDLGFRLFSGLPCVEFKPLYDTMDPSFMHYIPATSEETALGIINGFWFTGQRGAILLGADNIYRITPDLEKINMAYKIPALIIVPSLKYKLSKSVLTATLKDIDLFSFVEGFEAERTVAILELGGAISK